MVTADALRDVAALARLSPAELAEVAALAREVELPQGAQLFAEGAPADGCWVVLSGHVALHTDVPGRGRVVLQTLGAGDVLGWSWLVPPHRWQFAATATEPVTLLEVDAGALRERADSDPALGYHLALGLFGELLARLQSTRARLLDLYGTPRDR